jgi:HEAT repeat protein
MLPALFFTTSRLEKWLKKGSATTLQRSAPLLQPAALGDLGSRLGLPKLQTATRDKDPSVALAAAHALLILHDDSGYDVDYEVLTGERRSGKGLLAEAAAYKDPKKLADLGFEEALGFVPFGGVGWSAFKALRKNDSSQVRAAAATVLAKDRDPKTTQALVNVAGTGLFGWRHSNPSPGEAILLFSTPSGSIFPIRRAR